MITGASEIFFRFFKHMLGCRQLLSHNQNGIEIQTYSAIIACMQSRVVDRPQADSANSGNDLLVLLRHGRRRRTASSYQRLEKTGLNLAGGFVVSSAASHAARQSDSILAALPQRFARPAIRTRKPNSMPHAVNAPSCNAN